LVKPTSNLLLERRETIASAESPESKSPKQQKGKTIQPDVSMRCLLRRDEAFAKKCDAIVKAYFSKIFYSVSD
jgi:hypothetical protein